MANNSCTDRRKEKREMQIDRRKSDVDVFEHVVLGVRRIYCRAPSDDRPSRTRQCR
jgi:hypothetical protein